MIIIPAIDLIDGKCVRLKKGKYSTAEKVAENPVEAALQFKRDGASWLHVVDLEGARLGRPINDEVVKSICKNCEGLDVEVGGGIRSMETLDYYFSSGVKRVVLGTCALTDKNFIRTAVEKYGDRIIVGIDVKEGLVAVNGWENTTRESFLGVAKEMEEIGVKTIIFTDIARDGMLNGPNTDDLKLLRDNTNCNIIASGGIRNIDDIKTLAELELFGAIAGKALYHKTLELKEAILFAKENYFNKFFLNSDLIPAVVQEDSTGEVLMLAYMNKEALRKTLLTGYTWFFSRSRNELWNKGSVSGNTQRVVRIFADCDLDAILVKVNQKGNACHTGNHSCFFNELWR